MNEINEIPQQHVHGKVPSSPDCSLTSRLYHSGLSSGHPLDLMVAYQVSQQRCPHRTAELDQILITTSCKHSSLTLESLYLLESKQVYSYLLSTHADVGKAFSRACLSVCLSVCPHSKRKKAWAINTKLGIRILYSSRLACTNPEVKRLKIKVTRLRKTSRSRGC